MTLEESYQRYGDVAQDFNKVNQRRSVNAGVYGVLMMLNQPIDDDAYDAEITSIEEHQAVFDHNLSGLKAWEAWDKDGWIPVELPGFAARTVSTARFLREVSQAGLHVAQYHRPGVHGPSMMDFIVTKSEGAAAGSTISAHPAPNRA